VTTTPLVVVAALSAALLSSMLTFLATQYFHRRRDQLALINRQLSDLYGPLASLRAAVHIAWKEFRRQHTGSMETPMTGREIVDVLDDHLVWHQWVTLVFMPGNRRAYETILNHGDLFIEGGEVPDPVALFMLHVSGWDIGLANYERTGDKYSLESVISYPNEFDDYVLNSYAQLKSRQETLLGKRKPSRWSSTSAGGSPAA